MCFSISWDFCMSDFLFCGWAVTENLQNRATTLELHIQRKGEKKLNFPFSLLSRVLFDQTQKLCRTLFQGLFTD